MPNLSLYERNIGIDIHGADHLATLDAHIHSHYQTFRTGEYVWLGFPAMAGSQAFIADRLYAHPIVVPRTMTFDRIAIDLKVGAAGAARLGIYKDGTNHYPGALELDAGTVDTTSATVVAVTISKQLTKGLYWLAAVSNALATPYTTRTHWIEDYAAHPNPVGMSATDFGTGAGAYTGWRVTFTYAALPDPFTAGGTQIIHIPAGFLRLLTLD